MLGISLEKRWIHRTRLLLLVPPGLPYTSYCVDRLHDEMRTGDLIIIVTNYLQNTIATKAAWIAPSQQTHHTKP